VTWLVLPMSLLCTTFVHKVPMWDLSHYRGPFLWENGSPFLLPSTVRTVVSRGLHKLFFQLFPAVVCRRMKKQFGVVTCLLLPRYPKIEIPLGVVFGYGGMAKPSKVLLAITHLCGARQSILPREAFLSAALARTFR